MIGNHNETSPKCNYMSPPDLSIPKLIYMYMWIIRPYLIETMNMSYGSLYVIIVDHSHNVARTILRTANGGHAAELYYADSSIIAVIRNKNISISLPRHTMVN